MDSHAFGQYAEAQAAAFLERRGYTILARNYRIRTAEIDLIAWDGEVLVFAEVKARGSAAYGAPREAVTPRKQARIVQAARHWLAHTAPDDSYRDACARFDVIEVYAGRIAHWRNAYETPDFCD